MIYKVFLFLLFSSITLANSSDFNRFESIRVEINSGSSSLEVLNKSSNLRQFLNSTKNINFDLKYLEHWSIKHRSYIGFQISDLAYTDSNNRSQPLLSTSGKIGHIFNINNRLGLNIELLNYSHPNSDQNLSLSLGSNIALKTAYRLDLFESGPFIKIGLGQSILFSNSDLEYDSSLYIRKIHRKFSLELNISSKKGSWSNEVTKTSFDDFFIGTKISIPFYQF